MVLTNLCTHNSTALDAVKSAVFPHAYLPVSNVADNNSQAKMDPTDVPPGTLRCYLIKLMISLDSQLKRCVAEFLFVLCLEDGKCKLAHRWCIRAYLTVASCLFPLCCVADYLMRILFFSVIFSGRIYCED